MRILYLCHRVPFPPNKGEKIRAFHQIRALAARHEVDLFTLADDPEDLRHRDELAGHVRRVSIEPIRRTWSRLWSFRVLGSGRPQTLPYFYSNPLDWAIREALAGRAYDRIVVYCSSMFQYVEHAAGIPILVDLVDVDSNKWLQYATRSRFPLSALYRREGVCLRRYERLVCDRASCVVVTTEQEAELVREISAAARVEVALNGVDTEYFDPARVRAEGASPTVVFCGDMSYFPNEGAARFFALEALPLIRRAVPEARFLIVGRNPGKGVRELERIPGVEVTGSVPDVRPYLARAAVSVAPFSIAAGIQNKILEAMAFGLPVVCSARAARGLPAGLSSGVRTADTAAELAEALTPLLRDPAQARSEGAGNRRRVAECSWERALHRFTTLVETLDAGAGGAHDSDSRRAVSR